MSRATKAKRDPATGERGHYHFRLFMVRDGSNSKQALSNLGRICREYLKGRCTIETVDVVKNFKAAIKDNILITPALVLVAPLPRVTILGNLSDQQKVLFALGLSKGNG